jgi:hypothetical protein
MAAPIGNTNRANGKRFANALKAALEEYESDKVKRGEALREIAKGLVLDALSGDATARREVADRLDGKPAQSVTLGGDPDNPVQTVSRVERVIVDANASNTNG